MHGPSAYWYLTRGSGVVALLLLTAAMVVGVASTSRWSAARWPRFLVSAVHRNVTLLAVVFVVVHVVTTVADGYAPIRLLDAIVPFRSPYRSLWLGLGAVAFDLLLALVVTSLLRARVGLRLWRGVHWLAYVSWPVALLHALGTGSDARTGWLEATAFGCMAAVALVIVWRLAGARGRPGPRVVAAGALGLVALLLVGWYRSGPLRPGWAARAGTPVALRAPAAAAPGRTVATTVPATAFAGRFAGTISESQPDGNGLVTVVVRGASRSADARLHLALRGIPLDGGGVQMTASAVGFARGATPYTGTITSLEGTRVGVLVHDAAGHAVRLELRLTIASNGAVGGELRGRPAGSSEGPEE